MQIATSHKPRHYLVASDFDQTLSFNDSGHMLSNLMGLTDFHEKVGGLAATHLVQQGAELAYLLRHDPAFRSVRPDHLRQAGRLVQLKRNVEQFIHYLQSDHDIHFSFFVISAAPQEIVESALDGLLSPDQIFATKLRWDESGEIGAVERVAAGYGKVAVLEELRESLHIRPDHVIYVGDGSSDLHVMHHVNKGDGLTIAVSNSAPITRVAKRTILSDNALSVLVPILEDVAGWSTAEIREVFEPYGLVLQEWAKARTDWLTLEAQAS